MKKDQITSLYQSQYQLLDSCETKLNRRHRNSLWVKNPHINGFHIRVIALLTGIHRTTESLFI